MEINMNVGDYVRTNYGISKILELEDINAPDNIYITKIIKIGDGRFITDSEIVKSSPNLIDLIEVGDYVNEYKVISIGIDDNHKNVELYVANQGYDELVLEQDIKSIVTKQMFANMEYKVE